MLYKHNFEPEVLVLLGHGDKHHENQISNIMGERIDVARRLLSLRSSLPIIVTGGVSKRFGHPTMACSLLVKEYLVKNYGFDPHKVLCDEGSTFTVGDAIHSKKLADENLWKSIIGVTSEFHLPRTWLIFRLIFGSDYTIQWRSSRTKVSVWQFLMLVLKEIILTLLSLGYIFFIRLGFNRRIWR